MSDESLKRFRRLKRVRKRDFVSQFFKTLKAKSKEEPSEESQIYVNDLLEKGRPQGAWVPVLMDLVG